MGNVDFDPGTGITNLISNGSSDVYINKLNSSGNFIWARSFGSSNGDMGYALNTDNAGNVYSTGHVAMGSVDFDPESGTNILNPSIGDAYISILDSSGSYVWAGLDDGASGYSKGYGIVTDNSNNIYVTGNFNGFVDFDPEGGSFQLSNLFGSGLGEIFVQKLSNNTGIENNNLQNQITIYPNPTTDIITIDFLANTYKQVDIEVYNNLGEVVLRNLNLMGNKAVLNFQQLTPGIYIVRANIDGLDGMWKIIKQ